MFEELDDAELVSVVQFWERVASSAAAAQLAAIAELARRRPRSWLDDSPGHTDAGDPLSPEVSEFAVDEIAAALRLSRPAAGTRLHVAVELSRLPAVASALTDGRVDVPKVRAVVDAVAGLDEEVAAAVADQVMPRAAAQTVGQLRASLSRAVLAVDPAAAATKHQRAVASRQVTLEPGRDGMAHLWALLPADAAVAVYGRVDALARQQPADDRAMDARRADALVAAVLGESRPSTSTVHVTVPAETALGLADEPGELAGHGPVPGSLARRLAGNGTWRKLTSDPATGVVRELGRTAYPPSAALADLVRARDVTCRFPGCRQPARRCDLDHVTPWPQGPTTADNLAALCRHHHRLKHQTSWTVRAGPACIELTWTAPSGDVYVTSPP